MYVSIEEVKNRIDLNLEAAKCLFDSINEKCNDKAEKLETIETLAWFLSETVTGRYSSHELEKQLADISFEISWKKTEYKPNQYLFVMTSASKGGGSTVLVNNWIRWDKSRTYSIAFTNMNPEYMPAFLIDATEKSGGEILYLRGSYIEKASNLLSISSSYEKIILVQHQADIIPNLAFSHPAWKRPVIMYNHANFRFSLGYEIADKVLHLADYDMDKTIRFRGVDKKDCSILQFPNGGKVVGEAGFEIPKEEDKEKIRLRFNIDKNKKLVVTMGEQFKLSDIVGCSFRGFAKQLVTEMNGEAQYLVIGPDPTDYKWKELSESTGNLARAVGYLSQEEAYSLISIADFYVPGFPMLPSGVFIAEECGVPYMAYCLIDRDMEFLSGKTVPTVDELKESIKEALISENNKYLEKSRYSVYEEKEWVEAWNKINNSINGHRLRRINPGRCVEKEEIINAQLLDGSTYFRNYISGKNISGRLYSRLLEIEEKYDLSFLPHRVSAADIEESRTLRPLCSKNMRLFWYTSRWMRMEIKGKHLSDYLKSNGYFRASIYGMGVMGVNLYEILKDQGFPIECFIDRNPRVSKNYDGLIREIQCFNLSIIPKDSDVIINTAIANEDDIRKEYVKLPMDIQILSLFDIIDEMEGNNT